MSGRALAILLALSTIASATDRKRAANPQQPYRGREAEARAESMRLQLAAELKTLGEHRWGGRYYEGDGLGANITLDLAPASGFLFEWHGCLGLYGRNYGKVVVANSRIRIAPELPNKVGRFGGIDEEFVPIVWGERRYLVPTRRITDFCNAINAGAEPRDGAHGLFLLRRGDENKPAGPPPKMPDDVLQCILDKPIRGHVLSVGVRRTWTGVGGTPWQAIPVALSVGAVDGVRLGMTFHIDGGLWAAQVIEVLDRTSKAEFVAFEDDTLVPEPGSRVSTRARWADPVEYVPLDEVPD